MTTAPEPIWTDCEGSHQPGHHAGYHLAYCAMCGNVIPVTPYGTVAHHQRHDILAMIERGDHSTRP